MTTNKTIEEILEQLWDKRGRHSKLPMYPKTESITEATQAIERLVLQECLDSVVKELLKLTIDDAVDYAPTDTCDVVHTHSIFRRLIEINVAQPKENQPK